MTAGLVIGLSVNVSCLTKKLFVEEPMSLLLLLPFERWLGVLLDFERKLFSDSVFATSELLLTGEQLPTFPVGA